jgi:hypothetical protein
MFRMVFEVVMVLAVVLGIAVMMKVVAQENKTIDGDDDDIDNNNA